MENIPMVGLIGASVFENKIQSDPFSGGLVGRIVDLRPMEGGSLLYTELVYEADTPESQHFDVIGSLVFRFPGQATYTIKKEK